MPIATARARARVCGRCACAPECLYAWVGGCLFLFLCCPCGFLWHAKNSVSTWTRDMTFAYIVQRQIGYRGLDLEALDRPHAGAASLP